MYTTLICDDNVNWLEILNLAIKKDPKFKVVAQAYDGEQALELIKEFHPDIIILDIVMPEYDGVYIVNHVRKNMKGYNPIIYILSGLGTDLIIKTLNRLDIDFYNIKPVSVSVIMDNLNILIKQLNSEEVITGESKEEEKENVKKEMLEDVTKNLLLRFGIKPHRISSKCVIDALVTYTQNPESFSVLTKVLYPRIAEKYGLNNSSVEKNIRNSITQMQENQTEIFKDVFSYSTKKRITNGEFISVMSDYINKNIKNSRLYTI